ncbi:hypothetical protein ABID56_000028 [Alkalibacillus flavidus]|uniref:Uncharacterized protein n=1 Tax=Alkalibacillus flavidus TaxID=546021 RepID=A0ABV2KQT8_9BACI
MSTKAKVLFVVVIVVVGLAFSMAYLTYVGVSSSGEASETLKQDATTYINESFPYDGDVVDTLNDPTGVYEAFSRAAVVELDNYDFQMLVFKHEDGELTNSFVAEKWEHELESLLRPEINNRFGEDLIQELWIAYPKNIGSEKQIDIQNTPSVNGQDVKPHIRLTVNRGEEDQDDAHLQALIDLMKEELDVPGGRITLSYNDQSVIFKDSNKSENF